MGRIYDIANRLGGAKPVVKISDGTEYTIKTTMPIMIMIKAIAKNEEIEDEERIQKIVGVALGEKALKHIESLEYTVPEWALIIQTIMAAMGDMDLEDVEEAAKDTGKKPGKR